MDVTYLLLYWFFLGGLIYFLGDIFQALLDISLYSQNEGLDKSLERIQPLLHKYKKGYSLGYYEKYVLVRELDKINYYNKT